MYVPQKLHQSTRKANLMITSSWLKTENRLSVNRVAFKTCQHVARSQSEKLSCNGTRQYEEAGGEQGQTGSRLAHVVASHRFHDMCVALPTLSSQREEIVPQRISATCRRLLACV